MHTHTRYPTHLPLPVRASPAPAGLALLLQLRVIRRVVSMSIHVGLAGLRVVTFLCSLGRKSSQQYILNQYIPGGAWG